MQALVKRKPGPGLEYDANVPEPAPSPGEALVEVEATAICGTDLHFYRWDEGAKNFPLDFPRIIGHEGAGVVRALGEGTTGVEVGDRVAFETHVFCGHCFECRTGNAHNCRNLRILGIDFDGVFANMTTVASRVLVPLPKGVSMNTGALLEPAGVAMHALQRADVHLGDTVLVTGCGPIGLIAVQLALLAGAARVYAVDVMKSRLEAAEALGAIAIDAASGNVADTLAGATPRRGGVDVAIEASGAADVYDWIFAAIRRQGTLVTVGHPGTTTEVNVARSINKGGVVFKGVFGRHLWDTWEAVLSLLDSDRIDLERHISATLPLDHRDEAFGLLENGAVKVMFDPKA